MRIQHFDDYHEINDHAEKDEDYIELGSYLPIGYAYCRHFAVYYKERPNAEEIYSELEKQLNFDGIELYNGEIIHFSEEYVLESIVESINDKYPYG